MALIVLLPGLWAAYVALTQSPQRAFIKVYLFALLFLPSYYQWTIIGIPDPTFQTTAVLPIFMVWLTRGSPGWKSSFVDILVFGYAFSIGYSEYLSVGYYNAQNYIANNVITSILCPYILAKSLIEPAGLREQFAKQLVIILFIVSVLSLYQFILKPSFSPWQSVLGKFFGGQGWLWKTQVRWGFARITGPYGHEILAGIILVIGYRIHRWLEWSQLWPTRIPQLPWLPVPFPQLLTVGLFGGAFMTLTRGPLSGAVVAAFFLLIGRSKYRWVIFYAVFAVGVGIGIPVTKWFIDYASAETATSRGHETIIYRWKLVINYIDIAKEKGVWGWGRNGWPKVKGQKSIDNHLLLLFLMHGGMGVGFLTAIFLVMMGKLFTRAMFEPLADPPGSSLSFMLLSLYIVIFWSIATVYMGGQTVPLFFLIVGWSEGYLLITRQTASPQRSEMAVPLANKPVRFRRILT